VDEDWIIIANEVKGELAKVLPAFLDEGGLKQLPWQRKMVWRFAG
jgi:hypothetical protein